jgi:hypothetical protein|eukprot:COSAG02_NODE_3127_length_7316_cov_6.965360_6_plen_68_part_00
MISLYIALELHELMLSDVFVCNRLLTLFGESAADESLRVVDHALHVELVAQQAEESALLADDDFPSL